MMLMSYDFYESGLDVYPVDCLEILRITFELNRSPYILVAAHDNSPWMMSLKILTSHRMP